MIHVDHTRAGVGPGGHRWVYGDAVVGPRAKGCGERWEPDLEGGEGEVGESGVAGSVGGDVVGVFEVAGEGVAMVVVHVRYYAGLGGGVFGGWWSGGVGWGCHFRGADRVGAAGVNMCVAIRNLQTLESR